jgi:hypothetical protein
LQGVFRLHQERRRRPPPGALQGSQNLRHFGAARIKRAFDLLFARIKRTKPRLDVGDPIFDDPHLSGDVNQLCIELAAILADCRDFGFELLLEFGSIFLPRAGCFELLLALFDGIRQSGRRLRRGVGGLCDRAERRKACCQENRRESRAFEFPAPQAANPIPKPRIKSGYWLCEVQMGLPCASHAR